MILGSGLIQASGWPKTSDWLVRDEFTVDVAAGSVNSTAAVPGPGARTVVDTENKLSVGSGVLAFSGGKASPTHGDPGLWESSVARGAGMTALFEFVAANQPFAVGFDAGTSGGLGNLTVAYFNGGNILSWYANAVDAYTAGSTYRVACILQTAGMFVFVKGGIEFANWTLVWLYSGSNGTPLYPAVANYSADIDIEYIRAIQLPAPFDTDAGLVTDSVAGALSNDTAFTHEADFWIEIVIGALPSDQLEFDVRRPVAGSDANGWRITVDSAGTLSLFERVSSAPTLVASAVGVVSAGHRVVIASRGTTIKSFSNKVPIWTYAGATNFATATAGNFVSLGTGGAASALYAWPGTLNGATAAILDRVSA